MLRRLSLLAAAFALFCGALLLAGSRRVGAQEVPELPAPSWDSKLYLMFYADVFGTDERVASQAKYLRRFVSDGPYVGVGFAEYLIYDMPWRYDAEKPALSYPRRETLEPYVARLRDAGLALHFSLTAGLCRATPLYDDAKREDRRNAQWYVDGSIATPEQLARNGFSDRVWLTPSRYARKLRRHLETKTRLVSLLLAELRDRHPETLVSVSGDAEVELNSGRIDGKRAFSEQLAADYSPFAVAEFRDWIRGAGLYAAGQPYAGQGWIGGGRRYQGANGLANFNADFGTAFTTWSLKFHDWSLSDPVDADPRAIPADASDSAWNGYANDGGAYRAGGFDAPRNATPLRAYWNLWQEFRVRMVANYVADFASWVARPKAPFAAAFPAERYFTHQIPADYLGGPPERLGGTFPGHPTPDVRLATSASPASTAFATGFNPGLSAFDVKYPKGYSNTTEHLLPELKRRGTTDWALPEYSPCWNVEAYPETELDVLLASLDRVYQAGVHVLCMSPWGHFVYPDELTPQPAMARAWGEFARRVGSQPRLSPSARYAPPAVRGLAAVAAEGAVSLTWSGAAFEGRSALAWRDWPAFETFEVWRGATSDFGASDGELVLATPEARTGPIPRSSAKRFYRVSAITKAGDRGPLSPAVAVP